MGLNVARVEQLRMFAGSWFQAEGAATENERSARWRLERGTMKSPREVAVPKDYLLAA